VSGSAIKDSLSGTVSALATAMMRAWIHDIKKQDIDHQILSHLEDGGRSKAPPFLTSTEGQPSYHVEATLQPFLP
jgi:hypothetical protein